MKTPSTDKRAGSIQLTTLGVALLLTGASAHAADQTKANNNDDLTTTTSWVSGTVPGMGDRAIWDSTVTTANVVNLGGDVNFGQIKIATPGGNVTFNTGNMLTLSGVSGVGIDMSAAGRDLTLNNDVTVGANQNWIVKNNPAPHSDVAGTRLFVPGFVNIAPGITLTIGPATPAPAGYVNWTADNSYTIVAGSQIIINGQNNADSPDNHTGGLSVDSIAQLGAASITVNSNASLYIRASGNYTYSQTITNNGGIIYNLTTDGGTTTWDGSPAIVTSDENNPAKFTGDYGSDKKWDVSGQITGAGGIQIIQPPSRMGGPGQCCNNPGSWFLSSSPANDYAGNTTVVQGAFENGASDVIPNGIGKGNMVLYATNTANLLNGSSYWFMSGFDETINGLSDGGFTSGRVTSGHPGSINDQSNGDPGTSTLTLGDNNTTASFRGILENNDTLNLVKIGTGIQTLGGINTYNGTTVISNGTLLVNGSLADGAVSINGGTLGGNGSMAGAVTA
jgi:autotransporter-associated beta strand protein